jgi:hypothetical protein
MRTLDSRIATFELNSSEALIPGETGSGGATTHSKSAQVFMEIISGDTHSSVGQE